jgi:hypothetical protein
MLDGEHATSFHVRVVRWNEGQDQAVLVKLSCPGKMGTIYQQSKLL